MRQKYFNLMRLSILIIFCFLYGCRTYQNKQLVLNGLPVIIPENASPSEKKAAEELINYLYKISKSKFKIENERNVRENAPGLYVGNTKFTRENGINTQKLDKEEWVLRTANGSLILCGGFPRGTLYAAYEFLESEMGIRWFDLITEKIPEKSKISIPEIDIQGKPAFYTRQICNGISFWPPATSSKPPSKEVLERYIRFFTANKLNIYGWYPPIPEWGGNERIGYGGSCHNLHSYLPPSKYFKEHPEYYTLRNGKRVENQQICFTNPDVRQIFKEKLRQNIINDHRYYKKMGLPYPTVYEISVMDRHNTPFCECAECMKIIEREGADSGLILDFVNDLASSIKTDFPDVYIQTFAYTAAIEPPRNIVPADNVIIRFADYRGETCRPITHPHNSTSYKYLEKWSEISKTISTWDYYIPFGGVPLIDTPTSNVHLIADDIKEFHKHKVRSILTECERAHTVSFHSLRVWLAAKLYANPEQNPDPLIRDFMSGYYGPAENIMLEYMDFMEKTVKNTPQRIERPFPNTNAGYLMLNSPYVTLDYLLKCNEYLDKAEKLCAPDSIYALHVRRERIPVYNSMLVLWDRLKRNKQKIPFAHKEIIDRYYQCRKEQQENREKYGFQSYYANADVKENLELEIASYQAKAPELPDKFKNIPEEKIIDIYWAKLSLSNPARIVEDADAAGGKAYATIYTEPLDEIKLYERFKNEWNIKKTINKKQLSKDGKYELYHLGECKLEESVTNFYVWLDFFCGPERKNKTYDVYFSMKILPEKPQEFKALAWKNTYPFKQDKILTSVLCDRIILIEKD